MLSPYFRDFCSVTFLCVNFKTICVSFHQNWTEPFHCHSLMNTNQMLWGSIVFTSCFEWLKTFSVHCALLLKILHSFDCSHSINMATSGVRDILNQPVHPGGNRLPVDMQPYCAPFSFVAQLQCLVSGDTSILQVISALSPSPQLLIYPRIWRLQSFSRCMFCFNRKCNIHYKTNNQEASFWATSLTQSMGVFSCWWCRQGEGYMQSSPQPSVQ